MSRGSEYPRRYRAWAYWAWLLWTRLRLLWCWGSASSWPQCCGGGRLDCRCQYLSHSLVLIEKGLGDAVRTEHLLPNHGSVPLVLWDYALHTSVLILPGPEEPLLAVRARSLVIRICSVRLYAYSKFSGRSSTLEPTIAAYKHLHAINIRPAWSGVITFTTSGQLKISNRDFSLSLTPIHSLRHRRVRSRQYAYSGVLGFLRF